MPYPLSRWLSAAALAVALSTTARASLLFYEPFDYAPGVNGLSGQSGGFGFPVGSTWTAATVGENVPATLSGSLGYQDSAGHVLPTSGGRALADSTISEAGVIGETVFSFRSIQGAVSGTESTTLYLSFLGQQTQGSARFVNVSLYGTSLQELIAVGHASNLGSDGLGNYLWSAYTGGDGTQGQSSAVPTSTLSLLVLRIDLNANGLNERFRLYVNPTLGVEPEVADVDVSSFDLFHSFDVIDQLRIGASGSDVDSPASQLLVDEIRLATTFAEVAPLPEPGAFTLCAAGFALLSLRRPARRRM